MAHNSELLRKYIGSLVNNTETMDEKPQVIALDEFFVPIGWDSESKVFLSSAEYKLESQSLSSLEDSLFSLISPPPSANDTVNGVMDFKAAYNEFIDRISKNISVSKKETINVLSTEAPRVRFY